METSSSSSNQQSYSATTERRTAARASEAVGVLLRLEQESELQQFGERLAAEGFIAVRRFFDDLREYLRGFMDDEVAEAELLLRRSRETLPTPGDISPSWQHIWQELFGILRYKRDVLERIPVSARGGEWQVLLDNPYSNQHIAVYPGLDFCEAAYMYGYFRTGLEQNEYIRLQKVETVIMNTGGDE